MTVNHADRAQNFAPIEHSPAQPKRTAAESSTQLQKSSLGQAAEQQRMHGMAKDQNRTGDDTDIAQRRPLRKRHETIGEKRNLWRPSINCYTDAGRRGIHSG